MKHAAATLGSGNLRNAVALPDGEDLNEWVAVNSKCFIAASYYCDSNVMCYSMWQPLIFSIKSICCMGQ